MNTESLLSVLQKGRERMARGWCRGHFAEDQTGRSVHPDDPTAVRWCARGAVGSACAFLHYNRVAETALYAALPEDAKYKESCLSPGDWVAHFNNLTNQVQVVALFDRAIANVEATVKPRVRSDAELVAEAVSQLVWTQLSEVDHVDSPYATA